MMLLVLWGQYKKHVGNCSENIKALCNKRAWFGAAMCSSYIVWNWGVYSNPLRWVLCPITEAKMRLTVIRSFLVVTQLFGRHTLSCYPTLPPATLVRCFVHCGWIICGCFLSMATLLHCQHILWKDWVGFFSWIWVFQASSQVWIMWVLSVDRNFKSLMTPLSPAVGGADGPGCAGGNPTGADWSRWRLRIVLPACISNCSNADLISKQNVLTPLFPSLVAYSGVSCSHFGSLGFVLGCTVTEESSGVRPCAQTSPSTALSSWRPMRVVWGTEVSYRLHSWWWSWKVKLILWIRFL